MKTTSTSFAGYVFLSLVLHGLLIFARGPSTKEIREIPRRTTVFRLIHAGSAQSQAPERSAPPEPRKAQQQPRPGRSATARAMSPASGPVVRVETNIRATREPSEPEPVADVHEERSIDAGRGAGEESLERELTAGQALAKASVESQESAGIVSPGARIGYEELLAAWLERYKYYPSVARRRGFEGETALRIRIRRDGKVTASSIIDRSRFAVLDRAALDMVRRADPFPEMPLEVSGSGFEFVVPVRFQLD